MKCNNFDYSVVIFQVCCCLCVVIFEARCYVLSTLLSLHCYLSSALLSFECFIISALLSFRCIVIFRVLYYLCIVIFQVHCYLSSALLSLHCYLSSDLLSFDLNTLCDLHSLLHKPSWVNTNLGVIFVQDFESVIRSGIWSIVTRVNSDLDQTCESIQVFSLLQSIVFISYHSSLKIQSYTSYSIIKITNTCPQEHHHQIRFFLFNLP
jgi:hypothetical protein